MPPWISPQSRTPDLLTHTHNHVYYHYYIVVCGCLHAQSGRRIKSNISCKLSAVQRTWSTHLPCSSQVSAQIRYHDQPHHGNGNRSNLTHLKSSSTSPRNTFHAGLLYSSSWIVLIIILPYSEVRGRRTKSARDRCAGWGDRDLI